MKMIIAVIQPFMLSKLTGELEEIENFPGITVINVEGFGRKIDRDGNRLTALDPYKQKVRLEIVVCDELVETIIETVRTRAHTGNPGDGKIFVLPVEDAVRIQTGETGRQAI